MTKLKTPTSVDERILLVAEEQFLTRGFHVTSVDRIARGARVGKNSLYALCGSKEALFQTVVDQALGRVRQAILDLHLEEGSPEAVLCSYGQRFFSTVISYQATGLYRATIAAGTTSSSLSIDLQQGWIRISEILETYLEDLQGKGLIAALPVKILAFRFVNLVVDGTRYLCGNERPSDAEIARLVEASTLLFLYGYDAASAIGDVVPDKAESCPPPGEGSSRPAIRMPLERMHLLLDAARGEFFANGYHGASLDRAAKEAKVSKATIFRHFRTKAALFQYVVLREAHDIWGPSFAFSLAPTIEEALASLVATILDRHLGPGSQALHQIMVAESGEFPALMAQASAVMREEAAKQLRRCMLNFGWPMPGPFVTRIFYSLATDGVRWIGGRLTADEDVRRELVETVTRMILRGVATGNTIQFRI